MGNSNDLNAYLDQQHNARTYGPTRVAKVGRPTRLTSFPKNVRGPVGSKPQAGAFYNPPAPAYTPPVQHHAGGFGGFLHDVGHSLGSAGHFIASKSDLAAHDIAAMPAGIAVAGEAASHDIAKANQLWMHKVGLHGSSYDQKAAKTPWETPTLGKQAVKQTWDSIRHPLRDPFQGALTVASLASLGAGSALRAGAAASAFAKAGEVGDAAESASALDRIGAAAKAAAKQPEMPKRYLKVPVNKATKSGEKIDSTDTVQLMHSHKALPRFAQMLHDRIIERALAKQNGEHPSLLAKYGHARVGMATSEKARVADRIRMTLPAHLDALNGKQVLDRFRAFDKPLTKQEGHLALFLRSAGVTPAEISDFWSSMVDHPDTEHPALVHKMAELAFNLHQKGALMVKNGKVVVNKSAFPKLHAVDQLVQEAQHAREGIISKHDLLSPEAMHERLGLVAKTVGVDRRDNLGYTSLKTSEKNMTPYPRAGSSPVTGGLKNFIFKTKRATGKGVRQGVIPDNTLGGVADSLRQAYTYLRKYEHRKLVSQYGSDFRRSKGDVLVANPDAKLKPIPSATRQELGQERSTLNTLANDHEVGLAQAIQAKIHDMIPHLDEGHPYGPEYQKAQDIGVRAPQGYKWIHEKALGDLTKTVQPRSRFVKGVDKLNSAVTAATVYFKLSHIPQRTLTDATTSAFSGALTAPKTWKLFYQLRNTMTPKELDELAQSTGTHGYSALPHEDQGKIGQIASGGANFYSHHIDSHFRLLNLVHEARRAGINDVAGIKKMIKWAKNPLQKSKMGDTYAHVIMRANRTSMMYDGLSAAERRGVARAFWFYPWTKAAARYGGHVAMEHPAAALVGAELGHMGRDYQKKELGRLPSFEYGAVPLKGGKETTQAGWLWPFNTTSSIPEYVARPEQLAGNLNPAYGAAVTAMGGPNSYGESGQPHPLSQAADELFAPTPEARILHDYLNNKQNERKTHMFPHSWQQDLLTSLLVGPSYPRRTTKSALHYAHDKEVGAFKDIQVRKKKGG